MPGPNLYSTNPLVKLLAQERFFGDVHYVWCADTSDSSASSKYSIASMVAPTSNPKDIYQDLRKAVDGGDKHNAKIVGARTFYVSHAADCHTRGTLTDVQRDELIYFVNSAELLLWRPLLYVINRDKVAARMQPVPPAKRASHGPEYIISDLRRDEFEIVEL